MRFGMKLKTEILRQAKSGHTVACVKMLYRYRNTFSWEDYCRVFTYAFIYLFQRRNVFPELRKLPHDIYVWINENFYYMFNLKLTVYGFR